MQMQNNTFIAIKKIIEYNYKWELYNSDGKLQNWLESYWIQIENLYNIQWKRSNIANLDMALIFFVKKKFNYLKLFWVFAKLYNGHAGI